MFGFAKLIGVGVTAFVFEVTRPKLLQMAWFRWLYERVLIGLAWAHGLAAPIRDRIRRLLHCFARSSSAGPSAAVAHPPPHEPETQCCEACAQCRCNSVRREQPERHERNTENAERPSTDRSAPCMPVMTVAEASTIAIWNAAEANS